MKAFSQLDNSALIESTCGYPDLILYGYSKKIEEEIISEKQYELYHFFEYLFTLMGQQISIEFGVQRLFDEEITELLR